MLNTDKPKYQRLKEYIIEKINSREWIAGDRITSENELAQQFEVSRHTIRQSIGELVNEGWLYRVQGKGTFVNRHPDERFKGTNAIGVVTTYLNDYIFPSIITGVYDTLSEKGYTINLSCTYNHHEKERFCLENLLNQEIAGLIVEPTKSALPNPNIDLYKLFSKRNIPILFIHGCYRELDYSYVVEDDTEAGYIATKHLIELGHKDIAGIFKIDDIQGHFRFAGFQKAHQEAGLPISDSRIFWFETDDLEIKFGSSGSHVKDLLANNTAVVCYNDQLAIKLLDIARLLAYNIPEHLSIVSFDDSKLATASEVKLTTVAHPKEKLGREAASAIIQMVERTRDYFDIKMRPELVVRGSTKIL